MTQKEANEFMNEQFKHFVEAAENATSEEEHITAVDNAHKLFITLTNLNAFEPEQNFPTSNTDFKS